MRDVSLTTPRPDFSGFFLVARFVLGIAAFSSPGLRAADTNDWGVFTIAPYGWLAGLDGTVGVPAEDTGPSFGNRIDFDVSDDLEAVGFMFYGEWRRERWMAFFDSVWANVSQDADVKLARGLPSSDTTAEVDGNIYELALGYRVLDQGRSSFTAYGGARYYDIEALAKATGGILPGKIESSATRKWTDGVIGGIWRYDFDGKWHGALQADYGVGESNTSWQGMARLGYAYSWGSIEGGWRHLALDYDSNVYRVDLALRGPFLGVAVQF